LISLQWWDRFVFFRNRIEPNRTEKVTNRTDQFFKKFEPNRSHLWMVCLNTPVCSKTRGNELLSEFVFCRSGFSRNMNRESPNSSTLKREFIGRKKNSS
jgi:hypothetical protein